MNKQFRRYFVSVFIVLYVYIFCAIVSNARIAFNWRECTNTTGCTEDGTTSLLKTYSTNSTCDDTTLLLKEYIVESAGYFLKSHSTYLEFLHRVELAETEYVDYNELRELLYSIIEYTEKAKTAYCSFKAVADRLPYNQNMIDRLKIFDYDGFQTKFGLIESIYSKLKNHLIKGDVAGVDKVIIANMDNILCKLYEIKIAMDKGQFPETTILWRANQAYSEAHLFAQYMSEVFRDILF